jgi:protein-S-isoprenylcysteine O-methyltransferase Ste14
MVYGVRRGMSECNRYLAVRRLPPRQQTADSCRVLFAVAKNDGRRDTLRLMKEQHEAQVSWRGLWLASCNVSLAILSGLFAYSHLLNFIRYRRLSSPLIVAKEALDGCFFLIRRAPVKTSKSPCDWLVGIGSTLLPLLLRPVERPYDFVVGEFLQVFGLALQIIGIISLNRSFGIVAANRGIKTDGLYRVVRHPLYSSYFVDFLGYLINNFSVPNCLILAATGFFQVRRIFIEEDFLKRDASYAEYMKRTRWRLIPFVF